MDKSKQFPKLAALYRAAVVRCARWFKGIDPNKVVFSCLQGRFYSDSPRLVSERLHARRPDTHIVWLLSDKGRERAKDGLPDYVKVVGYRTREALIEQATARVWVDNFTKQIGLKPARDRQRYVQLWHGDRPIKKIGFDAGDNMKVRMESYSDRIVTGSEYAEKIYRTAFRYGGEYLSVGCPRNDILVKNDPADARRVREGLGIEDGVKLLLYAPTYRENAKVVPKRAQMDLTRTLQCLEAQTGARWKCLFRAHYYSTGIDLEPVKDRIVDVTQYPEMSELLLAADMVLTDYSSCATDFMVMDRPALFFIADWDEYLSTRAAYFDIRQSPLMTAADQDELEALIRGLTPQRVRENCEAVRAFFGCHETGQATDAVCDYIIDALERG